MTGTLFHQFLAYRVDFGLHALFISDDPRVEGLSVPGHEHGGAAFIDCRRPVMRLRMIWCCLALAVVRLGALGAHRLSPGERVQGSGFSRFRQAAQPGAAGRSVDPARVTSLQRTGEAAAAARLSKHLLTAGIHRRTLGKPLRGARSAADRFLPDHWRSPEPRRGEECAECCHPEEVQKQSVHPKARLRINR